MRFSDLSERQILKAQAEGQFDRLKGAGRPLDLSGCGGAEAAGLRLMAEAGVLPREMQLRKEIEAQRALLQGLPDGPERRRAAAKLADLQLRRDIEQEARRRFRGD